MHIIKPCVIVPKIDGMAILKNIERIGRVCYKSEDYITPSSCMQFVHRAILRGHESIIEHEKVTVKFIVDRGVLAELTRHRLCSFSAESTRYVNYAHDKCGNEVTVIEPFFFVDKPDLFLCWRRACQHAESAYIDLVNSGASPQEARSVLPNSLKTEVVVTANMREWRHILRLRCSKTAHPQMRQVMIPLLLYFQEHIPVLFDDIDYDRGFPVSSYALVKMDGHRSDA